MPLVNILLGWEEQKKQGRGLAVDGTLVNGCSLNVFIALVCKRNSTNEFGTGFISSSKKFPTLGTVSIGTVSFQFAWIHSVSSKTLRRKVWWLGHS